MAHNTTLVHPGAMVLVDDPEPWPGRVIGPGDTPNEVRVRRRVLGVMTEHIVDVRRVFRHQDEPMRFMPLNLTAAFEHAAGRDDWDGATEVVNGAMGAYQYFGRALEGLALLDRAIDHFGSA